MTAVSSLKFSLIAQTGVEQTLLVDSARVLVGSGAHCEIRLSPEDAAAEQLLIEAANGGVFAQARCLNPPALLNGVPFTQGRVLPESVLEIGGSRLKVSLAEADFNGRSQRSKDRRTISPIHVLGLIGFPLGFYVLSLAPETEDQGMSFVEPPALFAGESKATCPRGSSVQDAAAIAADELALAEAKSERAPFFAEDGVSAVAHYERAAACFRSGGEATSAAHAEQSAASLKQKLNDSFHVHQVRLERALATQEFDRARTEVHMLLSFVAGQPGEYSNFLGTLDRRIQLKYSGENQEGQ